MLTCMKILVFVNSEDPSDPKDESLNLLLEQLTERQMSYDLLDLAAGNHQSQAEIYDIVGTPAIVVAQDDGTATEIWQHGLPSAEKISFALGRI